MPANSSSIAVATLAMLLMLSACTRVVVVDTPMEALPRATIGSAEAGEDWWNIDFKLDWDAGESPDWFLDTLIADQICAPAIAASADRIALWRFHRRASRDEFGHRFRLQIYADQESAERVIEHIRASSVLQWLETDGWIESVSTARRVRPEEPPVARASATNWPPAIQQSWPWFIMGVSQSWLNMIKEVSEEQQFDGTSKWALLDHYRDVNESIDYQWQQYGRDAYLHQLNGVFGFVPLVIRGNYLMGF